MPYKRYYPRDDSSGRLTSFVIGCCTGFAIGSTLALLLAPHRGDITRGKLARKAEDAKDQVVEKVEDLMVHHREENHHDDEEANS